MILVILSFYFYTGKQAVSAYTNGISISSAMRPRNRDESSRG